MNTSFYDDLSPLYHLIYKDWEGSIKKQAEDLHDVISEYWPQTKSILDVSCGIGTQSLGLAAKGYSITASDPSQQSIHRARLEAANRGLDISFSVADMREACRHHGKGFDLVASFDNAVPHLLSDSEILDAFQQFYKASKPGGGCLISVRDYGKEPLEGTQFKPYGVRVENGKRYVISQVWEADAPHYNLTMYIIEDDGINRPQTYSMKARYYAIRLEKLAELMTEAGFSRVEILMDRYFQPLILGCRPE